MHLDAHTEVSRLFSTFENFARAEWRKKAIFGIKPSEVRVLLCIKEISPKGTQGVTVSEISKLLAVTSPTVTQIIKSLSAQGFVERTVDARDRRIADIKLMEKGEHIVQQARERIVTTYSGLYNKLGKEQSDILISLLNEVYIYFDETSNAREHD